MIGDRLGQFRIVGRLGAGGMGEVYRARDEQLDRDVAIKLLVGDLAEIDSRARLLHEARAAGGLNHPSICTIYMVGEADGMAFIAMELVDGQSLAEALRRGPLPIDRVLELGGQIADALAHAHAHHLVHRDLKSANVMLTAEGRAKVLDFGLARKTVDAEPNEATRVVTVTHGGAGAIVGTPAYMSPEQLCGEPADVRSDVWALGIVLYEMTTGRRPFAGHSSYDLSAHILHDPPTAIPTTVPLALRSVIDRCLQKDPPSRYQSAAEVAEALRSIRDGTTSQVAAVRYYVSRRPIMTALLAAGVLLVAIGVVNARRVRSWITGAPTVESIAVLPLENLSGDAAQDFFADGMTEVLSTDLARLGGLKRVTARGSVVRYKGSQKPLADIARELKVDALLTGSVMRAGNRVSITAQLLDPATGSQLWSNRYDRDLQDVLSLRNEIVSAIVREIHAQLSPAEQARLASARQVNPDAFEAYLKGRFHWLKQTRDDFDLAERYFQAALEKDPSYAMAYGGLATVWMMRGDAGFQPPTESFPKATMFIAKALELDENLADLHVALGNIKATTEWNWAECEREYRRAIELNPNLADGHFFYADLMLVLNRPDQWSQEIQRALDLDPLNDFNWSYYGWHLNYRRRYDEAIPLFQRLLSRGPNKASNYLGLWGAYYRKRLFGEAMQAARDYFNAAGDGEFVNALGDGGDETAYRAGMKRTGQAMIARSATRHVPALRIARMFAHAGETDTAIEWIERAYANRESPMMRLGVFWDWIDLHGDPRFQDLLRRLKLPAS